MIDIKNYIIEEIKKSDPAIDVNNGSAIHDFLINPLTNILSPFYTEQRNYLDKISLMDATNLTSKELDNIAAGFFRERKKGTKSFGSIYLYFSEPVALYVPAGTQFVTSNNLVFESVSDYSITLYGMSSNIAEYPNYVAGPIYVSAETEGENYNITQNTSFTPATKLNATPNRIVNKTPFTDGSNVETNEVFTQRLQQEIYGNSLASPKSIKNLVQSVSPTVVDVDIIGAGHSLMIRDLLSDYIDINNYKEEDFYLVYSGLHDGVYDKKHIALLGNFTDTDLTSAVAFPSLDAWSAEFSDDLYKGIYKLNDLNFAELGNKILLYDTFSNYTNNANDNFSALTLSGQWQVSDDFGTTEFPYRSRYEASINNGRLQLGYSGKILEYQVPGPALDSIITLINDSDNEAVLSTNVINFIKAQLTDITTKYYNNWSPTVHKAIDSQVGLQIDCKMSTNDSTEDGQICYITTRRNAEKTMAHDGYGIAWRKQPDFLIRIANGNPTDADLLRFRKEYLGADPTPFIGTLKTNPDGKKYWKYNVYLVDNDSLTEDIWISNEQVIDQTSGKNQFLQASKVWIEPNIDYNFRIKIFEAFGTLAWIWPTTTNFDSNTHLVINRGQSYPTYVPVNEASEDIVTGANETYPNRNHFGIGVFETKNCEWYVDNISIISLLEQFPMALLKFYVGDFTSLTSLNYNFYAIGYDPLLEDYNPNNYPNSKVQLGVYNTNTDAWETLGSHTAGIGDIIPLQFSDILISGNLTTPSDYIDSDLYINFAVSAANSGDSFPGNTEHNLRLYYASINNGEAKQAHRGNCSDIYVYDPSNIKVGSTTLTISGDNSVILDVPFIQEILDVREAVSEISFATADYAIISINEALSYSANNSYKILFAGNYAFAQIKVLYTYWAAGEVVNSYIASSENRYPNADYLVKLMPPTVVVVEKLEYSGGLSLTEMNIKIKEYINTTAVTTFDKSDLINLLYDNGATYVNTDIVISFRKYSTVGKASTETMTLQTYTVPTTSVTRLFTDTRELLGVVRL